MDDAETPMTESGESGRGLAWRVLHVIDRCRERATAKGEGELPRMSERRVNTISEGGKR